MIWQDRLKLGDWTVTDLTLEPPAKMGGELGHNEWDLADHTSKIRIDRKQSAYGVQRILVHELVHLRLAQWPTVHYDDPNLEAAVWAITDAFLAAYGVFPRSPRAKAEPVPAAAARRRRLKMAA